MRGKDRLNLIRVLLADFGLAVDHAHIDSAKAGNFW
ncbi:hypothetical protein CfE428DRAFT_6064 [Chthoniobacter flavus Ellin428]|uniref:Uncharacterized protein n=1 Tax=Chthoniobacter flavus Ellin428 TaxID=497964 RepID=B4DAX3_9BACT|nr:hypothetical protein CfE428DRAFT_6064 [Chthoniobacter flavus Ellin428]TCO84542.1 hypothetical protein EV701_1357 [Chthoniobacter flavus]